MLLFESIEVHDTLNPKLYNGMEMKQEVFDKLTQIYKEFLDFIDIPLNIVDVEVVGSNASYNYNENSDIDLHIIVNSEVTYVEPTILRQLYNDRKGAFNRDYDITVAVLYTPNFCFDGHLIVTGDTRGYLTFYQANENSYDSFLQIGVKAVHKHPIVSLFVFNARSQIASLDTRGNTFITYIDTSIDEETIIQQDLEQLDQDINEEELKELESDQVQDHNTKKEEEEHNRASRKQKRAALCALCDNESITTCSVCGVPLCNNCLITEGNKNYCPNCIGDASEVIEDESFE